MTHLDKGTMCNLKKNMVPLKGTKWNNLCMCMLSEKEHIKYIWRAITKKGRHIC